ncbi:DNA topoisomerase III [Evansella cellulosilytica]|uniref:DNA topoisomerase n=1 Tax=Evansella cellulosilytica (strain ATCC 21833 / DSM 2522 / FERM P-1141 / JCM 9156 / N-4) TaxID=649639 RepID=E6U0W9_EVAC2|nr:DNA topoisomerase III [Evansella cellulosilytica]ADU30281.1 DNA topoisomerase III [Evansella cellulosilytica DSM 2522]
MKLIIAEKPDQGAKLAAPFSSKKQAGFIEISPNDTFPKGALVTWAVGHLCELVPPDYYHPHWKKWSLKNLPIIPEQFQHRVITSKWKQFNIIKRLIHDQRITEIIIAGDAGREGEAIIRIVLTLCKNSKPMKRLWISSLTKNAVLTGFNHLLDEAETRSLYYEALSRSCADWIVGINASRAYTLLLQQKGIKDIFSIGRVQTPTLALIVQREKEIETFKQEEFWEVVATFHMNNNQYKGKWHKENDSRLKEKELAEKIRRFCVHKEATIQSIEKKRKDFKPPFLLNLSNLQALANKRFKYSPQKTLDIAQKLYTKGIISYPRSDSNFITKEEAKMLPDILFKLSKLEHFEKYFPLQVESILNNKRYVNDKKVSDHYAIIPTEQVTNPTKLQSEESNIYILIVEQLIAAHYKSAIIDYTTIQTLVDNRATFLTKGKEIVQAGWREVLYKNDDKASNDEDQQLPALREGESGHVFDVDIKSGKTQPPKRFTEGELITVMKTAGKALDDKELVHILKNTEGLGTEATRAGIIQVLKDRKYIQVIKNQVFVTEKGKLLVEAVGDSILASPEMTAKWEKRLSEIGEGKAAPKIFIEQAKNLACNVLETANKQVENWDFKNIDISSIESFSSKNKKGRRQTVVGKCKKCDGQIIDKGSFYGCSNYRNTNCSFTLSKILLGKTITQTQVKKLLTKGKTDIIHGFKKNSKTFNASLILNTTTYKLEFKWDN